MRAFFAIELPEELKKKIFARGQEIAKKTDVKLVEEENIHLTLLFLGEISEEEKERVVGAVGDIRGVGEIKLRLGETEIFPDKKRPHGIWINVGGEKEKLFSLYKKIVDGVLKAGIRLEEREMRFSPHITIGRFKRGVGGSRDVGPAFAEASAGKDIRGEFTVEKVALFQSQLSAKGPKYTKIGEFEVK